MIRQPSKGKSVAGDEEATVEEDTMDSSSSSLCIKASSRKPGQSMVAENAMVNSNFRRDSKTWNHAEVLLERKSSQDIVRKLINVCSIPGVGLELSFKLNLAVDGPFIAN